MFGSKKRFLIDLLIIIAILVAGFIYRDSVFRFIRQQEHRFLPCRSPITYTIGQFDTKFGITKTELLADIAKAERIWETPINKTLFKYSSSTNADVTINLIYDYRQKATDKQDQVNDVISTDRAKLNALDAQYRAERSAYDAEFNVLEKRVTEFNAKKAAYESDVAAANARGGATQAEFRRLEQRKAELQTEANALKADQNELNAKRTRLNASVATLNESIKKLNANINTYNTIGGSVGETFREGEYLRDVKGTRINIYQFSDQNQLVRVMAHELGHAIGLEHNDNPQGIMYAYNQATNQTLTSDDLAQLNEKCGI